MWMFSLSFIYSLCCRFFQVWVVIVLHETDVLYACSSFGNISSSVVTCSRFLPVSVRFVSFKYCHVQKFCCMSFVDAVLPTHVNAFAARAATPHVRTDSRNASDGSLCCFLTSFVDCCTFVLCLERNVVQRRANDLRFSSLVISTVFHRCDQTVGEFFSIKPSISTLPGSTQIALNGKWLCSLTTTVWARLLPTLNVFCFKITCVSEFQMTVKNYIHIALLGCYTGMPVSCWKTHLVDCSVGISFVDCPAAPLYLDNSRRLILFLMIVVCVLCSLVSYLVLVFVSDELVRLLAWCRVMGVVVVVFLQFTMVNKPFSRSVWFCSCRFYWPLTQILSDILFLLACALRAIADQPSNSFIVSRA